MDNTTTTQDPQETLRRQWLKQLVQAMMVLAQVDSATALADRLDVNSQTVINWSKGEIDPDEWRMSRWKAIARFLNMDELDLAAHCKRFSKGQMGEDDFKQLSGSMNWIGVRELAEYAPISIALREFGTCMKIIGNRSEQSGGEPLNFAQILKEAIASSGLPQEKLERLTQMRSSDLEDLCQGRRSPSRLELGRLYSIPALGLDTQYSWDELARGALNKNGTH